MCMYSIPGSIQRFSITVAARSLFLWVQYFTVITAINKNSELTQISLLKSAFVNLESNDFMTMRPSCSNAPLFAPNLGGLNIRSPAVSATYFSELISKKKLELCS